MSANDYQVGGDHYKKFKYQHWDFAIDNDLSFPIACAVKYMCRWENKHGIRDLEKAVHNLEKAKERGIQNFKTPADNDRWYIFRSQLNERDSEICLQIQLEHFTKAITKIKKLIEKVS